MPVLWFLSLRIVFYIYVDLVNAGLRPRVIGRCLPRSFQQFDITEFLDRQTAPILRRADRSEAALALPRVLIAQHTQLPLSVPPQFMDSSRLRPS